MAKTFEEHNTTTKFGMHGGDHEDGDIGGAR
jgi:hypothetical protein